MGGVISLEVTGASGITRFDVVAQSCSLGIGGEVSIVAGFADGSYTLINGGLIDTITAERPPGVYRVTGRDKLKLAIDNFIVSADLDESAFFNASPGEPGNYELVTPGEVIDAILAECGLEGATGGAGEGWLLGTVEKGTPFQLVSAWDAIQQVCSIGAWKVWCTASGNIRFNSIFEPGGGGGSLTTGDSGQVLSCSHGSSDEDLRNKIVVIGAPNPDGGYYSATASAASPYVPGGYKTAVVSTDLIGSDEQAEASAVANLAALNKLTEITTAEATGIGLELYGSVSVSESFTGGGGGMITSITHSIDDNGYRVRLRAKAV